MFRAITRSSPLYSRAITYEDLLKKLFGKGTNTPVFQAMQAYNPLEFVPLDIKKSQFFRGGFFEDGFRFRRYVGYSIGYGQSMGSLATIRTMLETSKILHAQRILEIGTGSGYTAALIKHLNPRCRVVSVDVNPRFIGLARQNLRENSERTWRKTGKQRFRHNLELRAQNAFDVMQECVPFDRIIIHGQLPIHPVKRNAAAQCIEKAIAKDGLVTYIKQEGEKSYCHRFRKGEGSKKLQEVDSLPEIIVSESIAQRL